MNLDQTKYLNIEVGENWILSCALCKTELYRTPRMSPVDGAQIDSLVEHFRQKHNVPIKEIVRVLKENLFERLIAKVEKGGRMPRAKSRYAVTAEDAVSVTIMDLGGPTDLSVTNDAENVVRDMQVQGILGRKKLYYVDSMGNLDELEHDGQGRFIGFKPGPERR